MSRIEKFPDDSKGGSDFDYVILADDDKPFCMQHGAMNRVSETAEPSIWRCIVMSGAKYNPCRSACWWWK